MVVAENMQRGIPVIASDLGSFVEVLGESGVIFQRGDAVELAGRISELLRSPHRREEIQILEKGRAEKQFARSKMVGEHRSLYQKVRSRAG
jgi:glycosyltransferase involved in cell wall biosynthesis